MLTRSSLAGLLALALSACLDPLHGRRLELSDLEVDATETAEVVEVVDPGTWPDADPGALAVAAALSGLRWELPCLERVQDDVCSTRDETRTATTLEGEPGTRYVATIHVRGVVEEKSYTTGVFRSGLVQEGGEPIAGDWNVYALEISDPPARYYLNAGTAGSFYVVPLDATFTIEARAGATITLVATAFDGLQIPNIDRQHLPVLVPSVAPWPAPFDGQFIQMDVVGIATP